MPHPLKRKRPSQKQSEEITFDPTARQEYLTGFHKRKLARAKHAQDIAARREREQRIETRKQIRGRRKAELEEILRASRAGLSGVGAGDAEKGDEEGIEEAEGGGEDSEGGVREWAGFEEPVPLDREDEFEEEDRRTTVTIEAVDVTREGFQKAALGVDGEEDEDEDNEVGNHDTENRSNGRRPAETGGNQKRVWTKQKPPREKKKKKKFRYESKVERKATRSKEKATKAKAKLKRQQG